MDKEKLNDLIGKRLRVLREARHLSLEQAAHLTGVSKPMLGQIERGQSNPTVSTLWKIANGLGVPFTAFIEEAHQEIKKIQKRNLLPIIESDETFKVYPIFPMLPGQPFELFSVTLEPNCHYISKPHPKGVKEYIWISSGKATLVISNISYTIEAEEGLSFTADTQHEYHNDSNKQAELLMVIHYPSTF